MPAEVYQELGCEDNIHLFSPEDRLPGSEETVSTFLTRLGVANTDNSNDQPLSIQSTETYNYEARQQRQFMQLVNLTQRFLREAETRRQEFFWNKTDTSSLAKWEETWCRCRNLFWDNVIGRCPAPEFPLKSKNTSDIWTNQMDRL